MKNPKIFSLGTLIFIFLMSGSVWAEPTRENTQPIDLPKVKLQKKRPRFTFQNTNILPANPATMPTPGTPRPGPSK